MPLEDGQGRWTAWCTYCRVADAQPIKSIEMVYCCKCGREIWKDGRTDKPKVCRNRTGDQGEPVRRSQQGPAEVEIE